MTTPTTLIVWNGCDNYIELDSVYARDYTIKGNTLYTQRHSFEAFQAVEIDPNFLRKDEDGEPDMDGVLGCESGKLYRAA